MDWTELQATWQSSVPEGLPDYRAIIRRRTTVVRVLTAIDLAFTLLVLVWLLALLRRAAGSADLWLAAVLAALLVLVWGAVLYLRRGTWRAVEAVGIEAQLRELARRARVSIRLAWFNQIGLLVTPWIGAWLARLQRSEGGSLPQLEIASREVLLVLLAAVWLAALFGCEWWKRRKRSELAAIEAVLGKLADGADGR